MKLLTVSLKQQKNTRKVNGTDQQKRVISPIQHIRNNTLSKNIFKINIDKRNEEIFTGFIAW